MRGQKLNWRGTEAERFWRRVRILPNGCWQWEGATLNGYGYFTAERRKTVRAHKWAFEFIIGRVTSGLTLDHLCRNRSCVNPQHMEPVTVKENTLRGFGITAINARKTKCPYGHTYDIKTKTQRECSICNRRKWQKYNAKRQNRNRSAR